MSPRTGATTQPGRHDAANRLALFVILGGLGLLMLLIPVAKIIGDRKNESPQAANVIPAQAASPFEGVWFPDGYVSRIYVLTGGGSGEFRLYQNSQLVENRPILWTSNGSSMSMQWTVPDGKVQVDYQLVDSDHMTDKFGERWNRLAGGTSALNQAEGRVGR